MTGTGLWCREGTPPVPPFKHRDKSRRKTNLSKPPTSWPTRSWCLGCGWSLWWEPAKEPFPLPPGTRAPGVRGHPRWEGSALSPGRSAAAPRMALQGLGDAWLGVPLTGHRCPQVSRGEGGRPPGPSSALATSLKHTAGLRGGHPGQATGCPPPLGPRALSESRPPCPRLCGPCSPSGGHCAGAPPTPPGVHLVGEGVHLETVIRFRLTSCTSSREKSPIN